MTVLGLDIRALPAAILLFNAAIAWRDDDWSAFLSPVFLVLSAGLAFVTATRFFPQLRRRLALP